jgi:hypothetical protein
VSLIKQERLQGFAKVFFLVFSRLLARVFRGDGSAAVPSKNPGEERSEEQSKRGKVPAIVALVL